MRRDFVGNEISQSGTLAAQAMAEQEKALVQSSYAIAKYQRRNEDDFNIRMQRMCERFSFAEAATYSIPKGKKLNPDTGRWEEQYVSGLSIKYAEAAVRLWGNIQTFINTTHEDNEKRILSIRVVDFETNYTASGSVIINKIVERKKAGDRQIVGERKNSTGDVVFLVIATEQEIYEKAMSAAQKMKRNLILSMLPADFKEEHYQIIQNTVEHQIDIDPDSVKKRIIRKFAEINVMPSEVQKYFKGSDLNTLTKDQINELYQVYSRINEGVSSWRDELDNKLNPDEEPEKPKEAVRGSMKAGDTARHTHPGEPLKQQQQPAGNDEIPPIKTILTDDELQRWFETLDYIKEQFNMDEKSAKKFIKTVHGLDDITECLTHDQFNQICHALCNPSNPKIKNGNEGALL